MKLIIDIPKDEIPKRQEIMGIDLHFIDGKVCECTYPFEEITNLSNNDLISREDLRKAFHERIYYFNKSSWDEANDIIDNTPTVEAYPSNFCPNCGADMRGNEE